MNDLHAYCLEIATRAKRASADLAVVTGAQKQAWLRASSKRLVECTPALLEANQQDLDAAAGFGLTDAAVDRLRLTPARIQAMATALDEIALLPEPVGEIISSSIRPNGLEVQKVRVPLGVVFFIYESRPNVTSDAAAICVKSGNAVILRGGKEAAHSNRAIVRPLVRGRRRGRAAGRRRATGRHDRSRRRGRVAPHARTDRRGHSPRRREPYPPRERRGPHAGHQAFCRQLPRLPRSHGRSRHGRAADRELEVPAAGRVQRGRVARGACRGGRRAAAAHGQGPDRAGHRDPWRRPHPASSCPRPARRANRTTSPSISAR